MKKYMVIVFSLLASFCMVACNNNSANSGNSSSEPHTHVYQTKETVEAGCRTKGYTVYKCECGDSYKDDEIDALGHSYASEVIDPTTETEGYTLYTCSRCNNQYKDNYTDKLSTKTGSQYGIDLDCYEPGVHKVGLDIEAGEYVVLAISNSGYFCVSSDANGDDILFNDNFEINSIITVYDGEYLELSRCIAIKSEDFYSLYTIKHDRGGVMLKVGIDIPAGEYKLLCESDISGYYCIYPDSRHDDILNNNNFENSAYVEVKEGQYLILSRCYISNS